LIQTLATTVVNLQFPSPLGVFSFPSGRYFGSGLPSMGVVSRRLSPVTVSQIVGIRIEAVICLKTLWFLKKSLKAIYPFGENLCQIVPISTIWGAASPHFKSCKGEIWHEGANPRLPPTCQGLYKSRNGIHFWGQIYTKYYQFWWFWGCKPMNNKTSISNNKLKSLLKSETDRNTQWRIGKLQRRCSLVFSELLQQSVSVSAIAYFSTATSEIVKRCWSRVWLV